MSPYQKKKKKEKEKESVNDSGLRVFSTQPNLLQGSNSTHVNRVGLGWTYGLDKFIYFLKLLLLLLLLNWVLEQHHHK